MNECAPKYHYNAAVASACLLFLVVLGMCYFGHVVRLVALKRIAVAEKQLEREIGGDKHKYTLKDLKDLFSVP